MCRVLDRIDRHRGDDVDFDTMSRIAAFSHCHFQRRITAAFGLSLDRYVQLARMKRAAYRLADRDADRVIDIAMDAGYDASAAFARAFRGAVPTIALGFPDIARPGTMADGA